MISADGWEKTANSIPVPDMSSQEVGNIGGDEVYPQSSITFYKSNSSEIIYSALPEGTSGYVVKMLDGQVATKESEVFKVEVATRTRPTQRSQAARFVVNFTVDPPTKGAVAA